MARLAIGEVVRSRVAEYTVGALLGAGGQGEVYRVTSNCSPEPKALKWYYSSSATPSQKKILERLVMKGSPAEYFLWPEDIVEKLGPKDQFGYIMPLRTKDYCSINDLLRRLADPTFLQICKAAYQLAEGFDLLHRAGFVYRDISFGNVFVNPHQGSVLICDNDNVAPADGACTIYGTPKFMAPEIVRGEAQPGLNTDKYSLAVLLFYLFMLHHPLDGRREAAIKCMDMLAMRKLYGDYPLFIYDPEDAGNRPIGGYQDNAIVFWALYPVFLQQLFVSAFTTGLKSPGARITEGEWCKAIARLAASLVTCRCKRQNFYDLEKEQNLCWGCGSVLSRPLMLQVGGCSAMLTPGAKLYQALIGKPGGLRQSFASVVTSAKYPILLRNDSQVTWTYKTSAGQMLAVKPGQSVPAVAGNTLEIGPVAGKFA